MTATSTVKLSVDDTILSRSKKEIAHLAVVGHFLGGLKSTKTRIEEQKTLCGNCFIESISARATIEQS